MNALLLFVTLAAIIGVSGCSANEDYGRGTVTVNELEFDVEVPLKDEGFVLGLMHREHLDDYKGMLFAYPDSAPRSFWMKNTLIPLDMLFIDENFEIRTIHHAVPCEEDPCKSYPSTVPVQYVLEIRGNLTAESGINVGDKVEIKIK